MELEQKVVLPVRALCPALKKTPGLTPSLPTDTPLLDCSFTWSAFVRADFLSSNGAVGGGGGGRGGGGGGGGGGRLAGWAGEGGRRAAESAGLAGAQAGTSGSWPPMWHACPQLGREEFSEMAWKKKIAFGNWRTSLFIWAVIKIHSCQVLNVFSVHHVHYNIFSFVTSSFTHSSICSVCAICQALGYSVSPICLPIQLTVRWERQISKKNKTHSKQAKQYFNKSQGFPGGSVVKICLPMQKTQVWSLTREDPTYPGAIKFLHHNDWARALKSGRRNYWGCESHSLCLQGEKLSQWELYATTPRK